VSKYPAGLTLTADERHQAGYDTQGPAPGSPVTRIGKLIKLHRFPVHFTDGTDGACSYERLGPAYHRFDYRYADGATLPRQYVTQPVTSTPGAIEAKGQELATDCFLEAIVLEQKDYFKRISPPTDGTRQPRPERFSMTAKKARELAGKYAICQRIGKKLVPLSLFYDTIAEANDAWKRVQPTDWIVACVNRMDRCLEQPKYNVLYGEGHPKKEVIPSE
jgi:hypothetical protein